VKDTWDLTAPGVDLNLDQFTTLVQAALPGATVVDSAPTQGGFANANYRLTLAGRQAPLLIRFFVRDPQAAAVEFAITGMLAGRVPIARYLHVAADNPFTGHPFGIREWIVGERLDVASHRLAGSAVADIGQSVGAILAKIHAVAFARTGFLDATLRVARPVSVGGDGLVEFLKLCLIDGRGAQRIEPDLAASLISFAERAGRILDEWAGDPCLVHSDFGGANILIRCTNGRWEVASVLDWEFAFSGTPFFDFGNLLRPPLDRWPGFETAVVEGYLGGGGKLPDNWRRMSLLADLYNWADFLNRPHATAALIADATAMIRRTMAMA
jgi:aminoglycoside phosphotransferase (APT) family kinase protein